MMHEILTKPEFQALHAAIRAASEAHTIGYIQMLRIWIYRPDGCAEFPACMVEMVCRWVGAPGALLAAMLDTGFLEDVGNGMVRVPDYEKCAPRRVKDRQRQRRRRQNMTNTNRQKQTKTNTNNTLSRDCHVTVTRQSRDSHVTVTRQSRDSHVTGADQGYISIQKNTQTDTNTHKQTALLHRQDDGNGSDPLGGTLFALNNEDNMYNTLDHSEDLNKHNLVNLSNRYKIKATKEKGGGEGGGCSTPPTEDAPDDASPRKMAYPADFEAFWAAYPSKTGKGAALRAWKKAQARPSVDVLLNAINEQKASRRWIQGFVPNPATWLNQRRWEDEVNDCCDGIYDGTGTTEISF